ncbi:hypothetical protein [Haloferula sargassicola]|uniref:DUF4034 domain-containing protein n=1 Tax=Haloferula sargassicola TaxID=490096 RepID=A0ABP9UPB9_9BACT
MKPTTRILSHLGALALGAGLAAALHGTGFFSENEATAAEAKSLGKSAPEAAEGKKGKALSGREARIDAYRAAWAALIKEPLTMGARINAQVKLLREWAAYDLDSAIEAYLGEAWDAQQDGRIFLYNPLAQAFSEAFTKQPIESWNALGRNLMAKQLLAQNWMFAQLDKEPNLVASMLGEMPESVQGDFIRALNYQFTPSVKEELLATMAAKGEPGQVEKWMSHLYLETSEGGDPQLLFEEWSKAPEGGDRIREMAAWAHSIRRMDPEAFSAQWDKVPEADRGQAARLLLSQVDHRSPALLDAIEVAVEAGEWKALGAGVADKLRGFEVDRTALAEWALGLPPREEVRGIFNLSISEMLLNDPVGGRQWLEALPAGDWHRESGFVEMMLGNLWVRGNVAEAQRAIDSITDPRLKEEAIKARYDWQLITSQRDMIRVD